MRILSIEAGRTIADALLPSLADSEEDVITSIPFAEASEKISTSNWNVVLADLTSSGMSPAETVRQLCKGSRAPVLALGPSTWFEKVDCLDAGAANCHPFPYHMEVLCAMLRAVVRRQPPAPVTLTVGSLSLDSIACRFSVNGEPVRLTASEYKILELLMHRKEVFVRKSQLDFTRDSDTDTDTNKVLIMNIRKKLAPFDDGTFRIENYRLMGYRLTECRP